MTHYGYFFGQLRNRGELCVTQALAEMDLTSAQGRILGKLACSKQPLCARDLEERLNLSHATVAGLLTRLERKGFLRQETDGTDRRCKRLFLEPKGIECTERIQREIEAMEQQIVAGFSEEEKALFSQLLERAGENLGIPPRAFPDEKEDNKK